MRDALRFRIAGQPLLSTLVLISALGAARAARADADAGAPSASASAAPEASGAASTPGSAAQAGSANGGPVSDNASGENCVERVPSGKNRPTFSEKIATQALSGHALTLEVSVEHGKGETVLPTGFHLLSDSPEAKALEREGFALPDAEGAAGPKLDRTEQGERATTRVRISVVPLPPKPGRHVLILPPLPITLARASGELVTVCSAPHTVTVR